MNKASAPADTQSILWHTQQDSFFIEEDLPAPNADKLLIRARFSLVSPGTERLVITDSLPPATAKEMRVPYMRGEFNNQFTYGYSMTGEVIDGPEELVGKSVHTMHPHQPWAVVDSAAAYVLPATLDLKKATLISNMETAINAIWDAEITLGDRVIVLGYGIIGTLLCALIQTIPGVELHVIETMSARSQAAKQAGLKMLSSTNDLPYQADVAFHTTASSDGLQSAVDAIVSEGTVIELSWYGSRSVDIKLGGSFHYERKKIISSQVSRIPRGKHMRWNFASRKDLVITLLKEIDYKTIITQHVDYALADKFFQQLRTQQTTARGIVIDYRET